MESIGVGKIEDILAHQGLTKSDHAAGNPACMDALIRFMKTDFDGLCFTNLVDTDSVYGHRNDPEGFAGALEGLDFSKVNAVCIGKQTKAAADALGMHTWMAEKATMDSVVERICRLCAGNT